MVHALRPVLRPSQTPTVFSTHTSTTYICSSCRHARLLRRPKRPYTFTQLVTLSDGSAFTIRTTSPLPVYRTTRDTRNAALWNPSSRHLLSGEDDDAGRMARFRARYGRGFDVGREEDTTTILEQSGVQKAGAVVEEIKAEKDEFAFEDEEDGNLLDLITAYGQEQRQQAPKNSRPEPGDEK